MGVIPRITKSQMELKRPSDSTGQVAKKLPYVLKSIPALLQIRSIKNQALIATVPT
jgi:hypothetical protein